MTVVPHSESVDNGQIMATNAWNLTELKSLTLVGLSNLTVMYLYSFTFMKLSNMT